MPPHLMPQLVLDGLMISEIAYQNIGTGVALAIFNNNKISWSGFHIIIGHYSLMKFPHIVKEGDSIKELKLLTDIFKKHDPHGVVK